MQIGGEATGRRGLCFFFFALFFIIFIKVVKYINTLGEELEGV